MRNCKFYAKEDAVIGFISAAVVILAVLVAAVVVVLASLGVAAVFGSRFRGGEYGDVFATVTSLIVVGGALLILSGADHIVERFRSGREPAGDPLATPDGELIAMLRDAGVPDDAVQVEDAVVVSTPDDDERSGGRVAVVEGADVGGPVWWVHATVPGEAPRHDRLRDVGEVAGLVATIYRRQTQEVAGGPT